MTNGNLTELYMVFTVDDMDDALVVNSIMRDCGYVSTKTYETQRSDLARESDYPCQFIVYFDKDHLRKNINNSFLTMMHDQFPDLLIKITTIPPEETKHSRIALRSA